MSKHAQVASSAVARPFFSLNANYQIAPGAKSEDLVYDAGMLLDGVAGTVNALAIGLSSEGSDLADSPLDVAKTLWGLHHQLKMIQGIVNALEVRSE